uniref:Protein kinase domain-containing protein n=2 Tax=Mesocestoides corti TaxID=53468 RepID=A0A5K3FQU5_MESCO
MDGIITRLRSTVSGALPGNPVTREYELEAQVASSGPGLLWKLYAASKKSSKEPATVWIFEKKLLDRFSKRDKEMIIEKLKEGVASLTRFRHPRVLSVVHPLEESRESLGFATEPLFTSLANALGKRENFSGPNLDKLRNFKFTETELKYGIIQICEALAFIHRDGHRVHLNVSPQSIVVNRLGSWKLCGFEFSCSTAESGGEGVSVPSWQSSIPPLCQPHLDYCAPEVVIEGRGYTASDLFSVGMLIHALYNDGETILDCRESYGSYRDAVKKLKPLAPTRLANVPEGIREYVKMLVQPDVSVRPDAHEILKVPFLDDANVASLKSLDELYQLDNLARSKFYKNLPNSIKSLPPRINLHRVFPQLAEEFSNKSMIPFVLPSILQIINMVSREDVAAYIMPRFKHVLALNEPVQIILVLLQNLGILVAKLSPADFKTYALPILNSALETNTNAVLELCLASLPEVAQLMDYSVLKSSIIPRLKKVYVRVELVDIRLEVLICMAKMLEYLDKWCAMDDVLAFLTEVRSREPKILVAVLAIYRIAFSHKQLGISRDVLASRSIPHLLQISMDYNLSPQQYAAFADLLREMFAAIESEQRAKLAEIHSLGEDAAAIVAPTTNFNGTAPEIVDSLMSSLAGVNRSHKRVIPASDDAKTSNGRVGDGGGSQAGFVNQHRTLEEKKRAMAGAENLHRLQQQPDLLTPRTSPIPPTKPVPKDLTDQLIESNIMLNWKPPSTGPTLPQASAFNSLGGAHLPQQRPNYQAFGGVLPPKEPTHPPQQFVNQLPPTSTMYGRPTAPVYFNQPPLLQPQPTSNPTTQTVPLSESDIADLLG